MNTNHILLFSFLLIIARGMESGNLFLHFQSEIPYTIFHFLSSSHFLSNFDDCELPREAYLDIYRRNLYFIHININITIIHLISKQISNWNWHIQPPKFVLNSWCRICHLFIHCACQCQSTSILVALGNGKDKMQLLFRFVETQRGWIIRIRVNRWVDMVNMGYAKFAEWLGYVNF